MRSDSLRIERFPLPIAISSPPLLLLPTCPPTLPPSAWYVFSHSPHAPPPPVAHDCPLSSQSSVNKATREALSRDFIDITGASSTEATRFLKSTSWRFEAAVDAFYNDPNAVRLAELHQDGAKSGGVGKNLEKLWERYRDPKNAEVTTIDGTILYCDDLGVGPEDTVMLAVAYLAKAPTMGRFSRKGFVEGWKSVKKDTLELQKAYLIKLRADLKNPDMFRKIYNFTFDYTKDESQKSMGLEIASELWNLLLPLDPGGEFPAEHLEWWISFLNERGGKAVSRDTWNLFLEFTRSIDVKFEEHDEDAAWPSLIDDYVDYARLKLTKRLQMDLS